MSEVRHVGPSIRPEVIAADPVQGTQAVIDLAKAVPPPPQDDFDAMGFLIAAVTTLVGGKVVHVARNVPFIKVLYRYLGNKLWRTIAPTKDVAEDDAKDLELARLRAEVTQLRAAMRVIQERERKDAAASLKAEAGWTEAETDQIARSLTPNPTPLTSEPPPAPRP